MFGAMALQGSNKLPSPLAADVLVLLYKPDQTMAVATQLYTIAHSLLRCSSTRNTTDTGTLRVAWF